MMQGKWNRCLSRIGGVALIGGLVLASYGGGIVPAEAHNHDKHAYNHPNPFKQILDKLNEISTKLNNGGGGGEAGNYTTRWDSNKPSASRFTVLAEFGGAAVRDNNTGLVWEQMPTMMDTWAGARGRCLDKPVGGTRGWRLPSVTELSSLMDPSLGPPYVPTVFTGVTGIYWSATASAEGGSTTKFSVSFTDGSVGTTSKGLSNNVWCVRGSMNEASY
ncbi:MAG: DUF1566 domain-containing protein [Nitrospira sp.]